MTGFNTLTQKLHCLLVLNDDIGSKLTGAKGEAFFRGFITEERQGGEVTARFRFRHVDADNWYEIKTQEEYKSSPIADKVNHLAIGIEACLRIALPALGIPRTKDAVMRFYPPNPDDADATMEWLIQQDLVEIRTVITGDREIPVSKGVDVVT